MEKMSAAGQCDPCIAGSDHMGAGVEGKNHHCQPAQYHRPAG